MLLWSLFFAACASMGRRDFILDVCKRETLKVCYYAERVPRLARGRCVCVKRAVRAEGVRGRV